MKIFYFPLKCSFKVVAAFQNQFATNPSVIQLSAGSTRFLVFPTDLRTVQKASHVSVAANRLRRSARSADDRQSRTIPASILSAKIFFGYREASENAAATLEEITQRLLKSKKQSRRREISIPPRQVQWIDGAYSGSGKIAFSVRIKNRFSERSALGLSK